jgi:soluble lytic murein transglycosylase-like protein
VQRKRAVPTVFVPILSRLRRLGRGSNTFCVGAFALSLVNLTALGGPQPAQPTVQPPLMQVAHAAAPVQAPQAAPAPRAPEVPRPAAAEAPKPAAPPGETARPAAPVAAGPAPNINPTSTPAPAPAATKTETPAPAPAPNPAPTAAPAPANKTAPPPPPAPNPNDEIERLRKAADLMVKVNSALGVPQSPYGQVIYDIAIRHSINPHLVAALIHVESSFNARAVSPKGAYGLMQLLPETARRFGLNKKKDLLDPKKNLEAGIRYLKWLTARFGGDAEKILAAYNAGEGAVQRFGGIPPYQETQNYVQKIFGLLGFSSLAPAPQPAAPSAGSQEAASR